MKKIYLPTLWVLFILFSCSTAFAQVSVTATNTNCSCNGSANGTATAVGTGGVPPYTYSWNPAPGGGQFSANATGMAAGTYTVTYMDGTSATNTALVTITQPALLDATTSFTPVSCYGGNDGTGTAMPTGGTTPYTYSWHPAGGSNPTATGFSAFSYTCFITDANGCSKMANVSITQPGPLSPGTSTQANVTCAGGTNGAVLASPGGGTAPYTYSWTNGAITALVSGLPAGLYTCQVTDSRGCITSNSATVTEPAVLSNSLSANPSGCGTNSGYANASVTGGVTPYTYSWSPGTSSSPSYTALGAGYYTCTVTDANGCLSTNNIIVPNSGAPTVSVTETDVACYGATTGTATANPTGGAGTYVYSWSASGGTTQTVNGLAAGTYTVQVNDAAGCITFGSVTVSQPMSGVSSTSNSKTDITCNGLTDGTATIMAVGGVGGYTYTWSPTGGNGVTASNLAAGTYTCMINDGNNCSASFLFVINQPFAINATATYTSPTCAGGGDGTASMSATGGNGTFTYAWNTGGTAPTITNLTAAIYTCTITDGNNCSFTDTVTVPDPAGMTLNVSHTNVNCYGGADGTATATVTGGTGTISYNWSPNGEITSSISSLSLGSYQCVVTDGNGCQVSQNIGVTAPEQALSLSLAVTDVSCAGYVNGSALATVSGGTAGYTYSWNPGGSIAAIASGLGAGTYTCYITDANNCQASSPFTINVPAAIVVSMTSTPVTCNGLCNGGIVVSASGGTGAYSYAWSQSLGNTAFPSKLCGGSYTVQVTDQSGCYDTASVIVHEPAVLTDSIAVTNVTCYNACNGTASITITGGTAAYTYSWMDGSTTQTLNSLCPGSYYSSVTDANGCTASSYTYTITQPQQLNLALAGEDASCGNACDGKMLTGASGGTPAYTYSWSSGQTSDSIVGLCPGAYTCTLTDANGCISVTHATINTGTSPVIKGTVTAPVSGAISSGWVYLVHYDTVLHRFQIIDSSTIVSGKYILNNSIGAKYLVYAIPDHNTYPHTIKTYAANTDQWTSAQVVSAPCGTTDTVNITVIEIVPTTGSASMSGTVLQGPGYVARYIGTSPVIQTPGEPVPGLDVNLEQHPGGIIAHQTTDNNGFYHFTSVPLGTFEVFVDVPGLGMVSQYSRTVATGTEMFPNLNYKIDSAHITPDSVLITGIIAPAPSAAFNSLSVSPNPFQEQLNLRYTLNGEEDVILEIYNALGQRLAMLPRMHQSAGTYLYQLHAADYGLPPGVYTLRMTLGEQTFNQRIVRMH